MLAPGRLKGGTVDVCVCYLYVRSYEVYDSKILRLLSHFHPTYITFCKVIPPQTVYPKFT